MGKKKSQTPSPEPAEDLFRALSFKPGVRNESAAARVRRVERLLRQDPGLVHQRNANGWTPLHVAVSKCQIPLVGLLVRYGADINARDHGGRTPFHNALLQDVGEGEDEALTPMAEALIRLGADLSLADDEDQTPLYLAISFGYVRTRDLLLAHVAAPDLKSLCRLGRVEAVRAYLRAHPRILRSRKAPKGVLRAAMEGPYDVQDAEELGRCIDELVDLLLARGADPSARDGSGWPPLYAACYFRWVPASVVRKLLERGADPNAAFEEETALQAAQERGNAEVVALLKKAGAKG